MPADREFVDYLTDQLGALGAVRARRMFGGFGLFCGEHMLGIVADDVLYLKADAESAAAFDAESLPAFTYARQGREVRLSFRRAPDEVLDDADALVRWARLGLDAARRSGRGGRRARKRAGA